METKTTYLYGQEMSPPNVSPLLVVPPVTFGLLCSQEHFLSLDKVSVSACGVRCTSSVVTQLFHPSLLGISWSDVQAPRGCTYNLLESMNLCYLILSAARFVPRSLSCLTDSMLVQPMSSPCEDSHTMLFLQIHETDDVLAHG